MNNLQKETILQAIFLADAYTMPLQWNYDPKNIDELLSNQSIDLDKLNGGMHNQFFSEKKAGEQTHYGDVLSHLLNYVKKEQRFDLASYQQAWKTFLESYDGYMDKTMKDTLQKLQDGVTPPVSMSSDFFGVLCGIPLILISQTYQDAEKLFIERSSFTHKSELVQDATRFMLALSKELSEKNTFSQSIDNANTRVQSAAIQDIVASAKDLSAQTDRPTRELINDAGLGCDTKNNLLYALILLLRSKDGDVFLDFMKANAIAGSDSSSRAIFLAFVLASRPGFTLPEQLLSSYRLLQPKANI